MGYRDILYAVDGAVATITLNRPQYRNAQSSDLLDELEAAFEQAGADDAVRVVILRGAGGDFSTGHDLGTPDAERARAGFDGGRGWYNRFKYYHIDQLLKWRAFPKPTIAMVEGYCIYGGWMLAAAMDLVFAAEDAQFLGGVVEYMSFPWDIGMRQAKELSFESRFITAAEAHGYGFVNRVLPSADLERETMAYARRVAENSPMHLQLAKQMVNRAQDGQGFTTAIESGLTEFVAVLNTPNQDAFVRQPGGRRLSIVDLALRGRRGERADQAPAKKGA